MRALVLGRRLSKDVCYCGALGCNVCIAVVFGWPLMFPCSQGTLRDPPGALGTLACFDQPADGAAENFALRSSEDAVSDALRWLAAHQALDGGWRLNHGQDNGHVGPVRNAGEGKSRTLATAVCMAGFLGAGQTHREGKYCDVVSRGLKFLQAQRVVYEGVAGDLRGEEGSVVCQAWATLALSEAYAMTQDKGLAEPAQKAVQVLELMRDPKGGGWGHEPRKPGDTLTTARVIMALKSAHTAYLSVSPVVVAGSVAFLNSVQSAEGAHYGLTKPEDAQPATHAAGIVCRAHLNWWKNHQAAVDQSLQELGERGPLPLDLDYNDFASHALYLKGHAEARSFQQKLRERLLDTQVVTGEAAGERGSWATAGHAHAKAGGRIYETATNVLVLSRRFRLPLREELRKQDDDF